MARDKEVKLCSPNEFLPLMGTFAKTAIVADQGKQTTTFHFPLLQTNESSPFPFAANKRKLLFFVYTYIHIYMLLFQTENGSLCGLP